MVRTLLITCLVVSLAGTSLAAKDPEPVVVAPSTQWQVDFGTERCRALRSFGTEKDKTLLIIDQLVPRTEANWVIAGDAVKKLKGRPHEWVVTFGSISPAKTGDELMSGNFPGLGAALVGEGFVDEVEYKAMSPEAQASRALEKREAEENRSPLATLANASPVPDQATGSLINWIDISDGKGTERLATGNLGELFRLMQMCSDGIVKVWGLDPVIQANLSRRAAPTNTLAITRSVMSVYPAKAEANGKVASMTIRVMIDPTGKPTSCVVIAKTDSREFGNTACRQVMKVAKFEPALDADGKPVESYWTSGIRYDL